MPPTVTIVMVQPLAADMISTSRAMLQAVIILTLIAIHTPVPSATIACGPEALVSARTT